jgi:hypothetical protein
MSTLERRTAKLEASRPDANQIAIIIRRIAGNEVVRAIIGDKVIDRRADEAEDRLHGTVEGRSAGRH